MLNRRILVTVFPVALLLFFAIPYYSRHSEDVERSSFRPFHPFRAGQPPQQETFDTPLRSRPVYHADGGLNPAALSKLYEAGIPSLRSKSQAEEESISSTTSSTFAGQTIPTTRSTITTSAFPSSRKIVPIIDPLTLYSETTSTSSTITPVISGTFTQITALSKVSVETETSTVSSDELSTTASEIQPTKSVTPHYDDTGIPHNHPPLLDSSAPQDIYDGYNMLVESSSGHASHPIDELIKRGREDYAALKKKRVESLDAAAKAYRERRGRHPPPGFDRWWEFSQQKGAIIIEDMFDQIYSDLEPFWGLNPEIIRETSKLWHEQITIRNGTANAHTQEDIYGAWLTDWTDLLRHLDGLLPDVDLSFNNIDESRVMVPWEKINEYMQIAQKSKYIDPLSSLNELINEYQTLPPLPDDVFGEKHDHMWEDWHNNTPAWNFTRLTCHPDSEARNTDGALGDEMSPFFPPTDLYPVGSYHGYVGNWTFARSACANPALRNIHGNFIKPRWVSVNQTLFPLFGGSKIMGVNNEIIVPAAKYWSTEVEFTGENEFTDNTRPLWDMMINKAVWRGAASGGDHNESNWRRFHRQRFMAMMNGTQVTLTEEKLAKHKAGHDAVPDEQFYNASTSEPLLPHNFPMPNAEVYDLAALKTEPTTLGAWSGQLNNGAFTHFMCHPQHIAQFGTGDLCFYYDQFYNWTEKVEMADQFMHKYLPDIDGNSYSGRYRAFLRSGSLPIKASIYTEWHDARLIPWVHFVPMDNSFADYWGILEYFAGYEEPTITGTVFVGDDKLVVKGHDEVARSIAMEGQRWANRVLRHEDMLVYMHRLVLEYARVTNDKRDKMGWAEDLKAKQ